MQEAHEVQMYYKIIGDVKQFIIISKAKPSLYQNKPIRASSLQAVDVKYDFIENFQI